MRITRAILTATFGSAVLLTPAFAASGTINAAPNPCTVERGHRNCTTFVTWETQGSREAIVFVRSEGKHNAPEKEFVRERSCASLKCPANFIEPGNTYVFTLYDYTGGARGPALGQAGVTATWAAGAEPGPGAASAEARSGPPSGSIGASPNPCTVPQGHNNCTSYITWTTQNVTHAKVFVEKVGRNAEKEFSIANNCEGQRCAANWIEPGATYKFILVDWSSGGRGQNLGNVVVTAAR